MAADGQELPLVRLTKIARKLTFIAESDSSRRQLNAHSSSA